MKFQHTSLSPPDRSRNPLAIRQQRASPQDHGTLNKNDQDHGPEESIGFTSRKMPSIHAYQVFKDQHHQACSRRRQNNSLVKSQVMPDEQESIIVPGWTKTHSRPSHCDALFTVQVNKFTNGDKTCQQGERP
jgi:hypothetical protein